MDLPPDSPQVSPNSDIIFDPIRQKSLVSTPEEKVRQQLISYLTDHLGYPSHLIIIEKRIQTLFPLLSRQSHHIPKRRPDLLIISPSVFTDSQGQTHHLEKPKPLLLIECKAHVINQKTLHQLLSYNYIIGAPCLSVVCCNQQQTGFLNPQTRTFDFYPGLPSYPQLLDFVLSINFLSS